MLRVKKKYSLRKRDEKTGAVKPMSIVDTTGNSYTVDKEGKVSNVEGGGLADSGANPSSLPDIDLIKRLLNELLNEFDVEVKSQLGDK